MNNSSTVVTHDEMVAGRGVSLFEEMLLKELENEREKHVEATKSLEVREKKPFLKRKSQTYKQAKIVHSIETCIESHVGFDSCPIDNRARKQSNKPKWKKQHEDFQELMKIGKQQPHACEENQQKPKINPWEKHPTSKTLQVVDIEDHCPKCKKKICKIAFRFHVKRCCKQNPKKLFNEKTYHMWEIAKLNAPLPQRCSSSSLLHVSNRRPSRSTRISLSKSLMKLDRERFKLCGQSYFSNFTIHHLSQRMTIRPLQNTKLPRKELIIKQCAFN